MSRSSWWEVRLESSRLLPVLGIHLGPAPSGPPGPRAVASFLLPWLLATPSWSVLPAAAKRGRLRAPEPVPPFLYSALQDSRAWQVRTLVLRAGAARKTPAAPPRPPRPPLLLTLLVPPTGQAPSCFRALAWAAASSRDTPLQMPPWPWPSRQSRLGSSSLPQRRPPNRPSRSCALPAALLSAPRSALPVRWQRVGNDPSVYLPLLCLAPASSSSRKVGNGVPSVLCWVSSASNRAGHTVVAEVC